MSSRLSEVHGEISPLTTFGRYDTLLWDLFELDFQAYYQHAAGAVEGIFARSGVDAAIYAVEEVVDTNRWLQKGPSGHSKRLSIPIDGSRRAHLATSNVWVV